MDYIEELTNEYDNIEDILKSKVSIWVDKIRRRKMSKVHVVDLIECTLDSYDVEDFCRLWNKGEIVDTHRNHYQYKFYADINKSKKAIRFI